MAVCWVNECVCSKGAADRTESFFFQKRSKKLTTFEAHFRNFNYLSSYILHLSKFIFRSDFVSKSSFPCVFNPTRSNHFHLSKFYLFIPLFKSLKFVAVPEKRASLVVFATVLPSSIDIFFFRSELAHKPLHTHREFPFCSLALQ